MAKECIERDAAIKALHEHLNRVLDSPPINQATREIYEMAYRHCENVLEYFIPAADVREVVRGEWKPVMERWNKKSQAAEEWYGYLFCCDKCGGTAMYRPNYCPNCGADMRPDWKDIVAGHLHLGNDEGGSDMKGGEDG